MIKSSYEFKIKGFYTLYFKKLTYFNRCAVRADLPNIIVAVGLDCDNHGVLSLRLIRQISLSVKCAIFKLAYNGHLEESVTEKGLN